MTCAIYIRVSTPPDHRRDPKHAEAAQKQETTNQRLALEKYATARGWEITEVYEEHASAGAGKERPVFRSLMEAARKNRFDMVLFWSLDRFSREGVYETLDHLRTLGKYGVSYCSFQEQYIDSAGPFRDALIGIIAALARMERERQSERVKAGLDRRRREGKHVGRKPSEVDLHRLKLAVQAGFSLDQIARTFEISKATAAKYRRFLRAGKEGEDEIRRLNAIAAEYRKREEKVDSGRRQQDQPVAAD